MSKKEKKAKEKKSGSLSCVCPFVKDYTVSNPPSATEIEDFVVQSEGEKEPFTGTIAKGKASFKSPVKSKKPPKIAFKNVAEARHCNNDTNMCAIRCETKNGGQLILLKFSSVEDVQQFISMLKLKNPNVKVVKTTKGQPTTESMTSAPADKKDRPISPIARKMSTTSNQDKKPSEQTPETASAPQLQQMTDRQPTTDSMASSSADKMDRPISPTTRKMSITTNQDNKPSEQAPVPAFAPHLKQIDTATSAFTIMYMAKATSPQYDILSHNIVASTQAPSIERCEPNQRIYTNSSLPPPPKLRSHDSREPKRNSVLLSSRTSLKSKPRNRKRLKSSSSSSPLSSINGKHLTRGSSRNQYGRSSGSSLSTNRRKRRSQKSKNFSCRGDRPSSSSPYSSFSGSRTSVSRYANKTYTNSNSITPKNEMHLESSRPSRRFSSVDYSFFSLMRISNYQKSITNLYSFGAELSHSKTSLSHKISSASSRSQSSLLNVSESKNGSNSSYISSSTSEESVRTRSMHSPCQECKFRPIRSPSPWVRRGR